MPRTLTYLYLDSPSDYAVFPKTTGLTFGSTVSITLAAFVKATAVSGDSVVLVADKSWASNKSVGVLALLLLASVILVVLEMMGFWG